MTGLMIAAMFSATASSISTQLNVFAGVLTDDIYCRHFRPKASDRELVQAGRAFTILIGFYMLAGALILPRVTTYRNFLITLASILGAGLSLPTLFGLFCNKMSRHVFWICAVAGGGIGFLQKIGFAENGFLARIEALDAVTRIVQQHTRTVDIFFGMSIVITILVVAQLTGRERPEWTRLQETIRRKREALSGNVEPSVFPAIVMGYCVTGLGVVMLGLLLFNNQNRLILLSSALLLFMLGAFFIFFAATVKATPSPAAETLELDVATVATAGADGRSSPD